MVRFQPSLSRKGTTFVVVTGVDGRIMPRDMRADIEHEMRRRVEREVSPDVEVSMTWIEELLDDEREIIGMRSQYAINTMVHIPPDTIQTDDLNLAFMKDTVILKQLREFNIPITEVATFVV